MKFLMLVCNDTDPVPDPTTSVPDVEDWVAQMDGAHIRIAGAPVEPQDQAVAVRVRQGRVTVTDGPFVETKEILAGFDLLECRDREHAIEVAAAHPMAYRGVIELRPLME